MKIRLNIIVILLIFMLGLLVGLPQMTSATSIKPLKIGCIMPYTGPWGLYGPALEPGIQIYADLLNEDGGVKIGKERYKIEMIFVDDQGDPKRGPIAAQELIRKGAVANVGCFTVTPPIGAVLTPAKILFVGQMKEGFDLKQHRYFIGANDEVLAPLYGQIATLEMWPNIKKVGVFTYTWQKLQADKITNLMKEPGSVFNEKGIKVAQQYHTMGEMDFTVALAKFKDFGVDAIYTTIGPGDYALLSKQANKMGMNIKFFNAGTATDMDEFIDVAGLENAQGMSFNWPAPWAIRKSKVDPELVEMAVRISNRYARNYKKPMTYLGGFDWGINHLEVLLNFYQQAESIDPDTVMKKVRGGTVKDFTGTWTMGGEKTWGAPVVKPSACIDGVIKGRDIIYGAEKPMPSIP
jgi:ABC-type branched-subunit amino acid transport system substrate-binding protein